MNAEERAVALVALIEDGLTFGEALAAFTDRQSVEERALVEKAREEWHDGGRIEVDNEAVVSQGDEAGAYVMAWVWVEPVKPDLPDLCDGRERCPNPQGCSVCYEPENGQ